MKMVLSEIELLEIARNERLAEVAERHLDEIKAKKLEFSAEVDQRVIQLLLIISAPSFIHQMDDYTAYYAIYNRLKNSKGVYKNREELANVQYLEARLCSIGRMLYEVDPRVFQTDGKTIPFFVNMPK